MKTKAACSLDAIRYSAEFGFTRAHSPGHADLRITVRVGDSSRANEIAASSTLVDVTDLRRLVAYLTNHIEMLKSNPDMESIVFVPIELGFSMQALEGENLLDGHGSFTLRFMVNLRAPEDSGGGIYVGCEGEVELEEVTKFISCIQGVIAWLETSGAATNTHR